jgi:hypothetical protein
MSRQNSLSIFEDASTKAKLSESYGKVIENIEKSTISSILKNTDLSGDPDSGSVEAKRIANTDSQAYGTARTGGKGQNVKAPAVVVNIDTDRELINEVEEKDLAMFGVDGLIEKKSASNERSMKRELERAFFSTAATAGSAATLTKTEANEKLEELIQLLETVKNDYVDGVERDLINVICTPKAYGEIRNFLDKGASNANIDTSVGEFGMFHSVNVFSSVYLPEGVDMIAMCTGAVAQPVKVSLDEPGKIPLSDAYHFGMFYYYGTKAVMPDLIFKVAAA